MANKTRKYFQLFLLAFVSSIAAFGAIIRFYKTSVLVDWNFINSLLPAARKAFLPFYGVKDTRNYILGIIIFFAITVFYLILYWKNLFDDKRKSLNNKFPIFVLFFVLVIFIFFPNYLDFKPYLSIVYYLTASYIFFYLFIKFGLIDKLVEKVQLFPKLRLYWFLEYPLIFIGIFLLLFTPRYHYMYESLFYYGQEAYHYFLHANFFIAPINEVVNGKYLLVNVKDQYGLLLTYIPAMFFKIFGFSYANFSLYTILLPIVYCFLFYVAIKKITRRSFLALLGTLGYIKIVYFRSFLFWESYIVPSTTAVRYFFDIVALLAVINLFKKFTLRKLYLTNFIVAIGFFYNFEVGLSIVLAYLACLFGKIIVDYQKKFNKSMVVWYIGSFFLSLVFVGSLISIFTYLRSGTFPNWILFVGSAFMYAKGAFDYPMPIIGSYYFPLSIYILTFFFLVYKIVDKKYETLYPLVFLFVYGILSFYYYVIVSETYQTHHLLAVIHPAIIIAIIFTAKIFSNWGTLKLPVSYKAFSLLLILWIFGFIFWSTNNDYSYILNKLASRYGPLPNRYFYWNYYGTDFYLTDKDQFDFTQSAMAIEQLTPNTKDIVILSRYDTLLYVMAKKTSLVNYPNLENELGFIKEKEAVISQIKIKKPKYIFVYSKDYADMFSDTLSSIWNRVKSNYRFLKSAGVIDVYYFLPNK